MTEHEAPSGRANHATGKEFEDLFADGAPCEARVAEPPHYLHSHRCARKGKAVVDGMILCTQHSKIAAKHGVERVR